MASELESIPAEIESIRQEFESMIADFLEIAAERGLEPREYTVTETTYVPEQGALLWRKPGHSETVVTGSYLGYRVYIHEDTSYSSGGCSTATTVRDVDLEGLIRAGGDSIKAAEIVGKRPAGTDPTVWTDQVLLDQAKRTLAEWRGWLEHYLVTGTPLRVSVGG